MEGRRAPGWGAALRATRPTKAGVVVLWIESIAMVAAWGTGRADLYAAAALLLAFYLVGHFGAAYAAASLEVDWHCPERVFAGEEFPIVVTLRHRGRVAIAGVEVHEARPGDAGPAGTAASVPGRSTARAEARGRVRRRGLHLVPPPTAAVRWPFHLAQALCSAGDAREVFAYPRRVPTSAALTRSLAPEASLQTAAATPRGGAEFRGLRDWALGDPPRAIAWRATARHDRMISREFDREEAGRAVVALDADARDLPAGERGGAVERACSLAASHLLRLRAEGRRVSFAAFAPEPRVVAGAAAGRGLGRALEVLAELEPPPRTGPRRDPLSLLPPSALRGARVLLVRAAAGAVSRRRGPHGSEVVVLPSLRGSGAPAAIARPR
ncbi:MAG TPA: DUF58 domain-containing protein [Planctomycetota bacterium]|nr:DUF58 domain-containing protein [Planctomycetota bacterium]